MDARMQELHLLSNTIFQNVACLTPYLRNVVTHAKQYQKSFQGTCNVAENFILSFQSLADAAEVSNGATKLVGHVLNDIIATFKEVEQMQLQLMKLFITDVIIPLESKAEEEINAVKVSHKAYMRDSKLQTELVEKARQDVAKVRKKSMKKKSSKAAKYEQRERDCVRSLAETEQKLQDVREQGLRMALIEERRIYCYISERMCAFSHGMISHNSKVNQLLGDRLTDWMSGIQRPTELPSENEAIVESPSKYQYGTLKKRPKRSFSIRSRNDSTSSPISRTTSNASKYSTIDSRYRRQNSTPAAPGRLVTRQLSSESVPIMNHRPQVVPQQQPQRHSSSSENSSSGSAASSPAAEDAQRHFAESVQAAPAAYHEDQSHETMSVGDMRLASLRDQLSRRLMQIHPESKLKLKAMYDHNAQDSSQLSFQKNDIIVPICEPTSGWQYGENSSTKLSGWFPSAYAEQLDQSSELVPKGSAPPLPDTIATHPIAEEPDGSHQDAASQPAAAEESDVPARKQSRGFPPPTVAPKPKWNPNNINNNNIPLPPSDSSASLPAMPTSQPPTWNDPEDAQTVAAVKPLVNGEHVTGDTISVQSAPLLDTSVEEDEADVESTEGEPCMPAPPPPPPPPPMVTAGASGV